MLAHAGCILEQQPATGALWPHSGMGSHLGMASVIYRLVGGSRAALLTMRNPPVNGLAQGIRAGLLECLQTARRDRVDAVVLIGDGNTFPAGADVSGCAPGPKRQMGATERTEMADEGGNGGRGGVWSKGSCVRCKGPLLRRVSFQRQQLTR